MTRTLFVLLVLATALSAEESPYRGPQIDGVEVYNRINDQVPTLPDLVSDFLDGKARDAGQVSAVMEPFAPVLAEIERAADASSTRWVYARYDAAAQVTHLAGARRAAKLLCARALLRFRGGKADEGLRDLMRAQKIGVDLHSDRWMVSRMAGNSVLMLAYRLIHAEAVTRGLSADALGLLLTHLNFLAGKLPGLSDVVESEMMCAQNSVDALFLPAPGSDSETDKAVKDLRGFYAVLDIPDQAPPADDLAALHKALCSNRRQARSALDAELKEVYGKLAQDANEPLFSKTVHLDLEAYQREAVRRLGEKLKASPIDPLAVVQAYASLATATVAPHLIVYRDGHAKAVLTIDLLSTWCRLELQRLEKGKYPDSLDALGRVPADPYDGGTLKYLRVDDKVSEQIVVTTAGPKRDWEARTRRLLDVGAFEPHDPVTPCFTIWAVRKK